ncbi:imidazole glycerol phosphate synthase subunit HisF [Geminocystis sp. CENA526]|uniref:imidazole glycerol phosphate synthase subunit HisF n=1 Tax=Geminocystis sp. CENA526 TaxID=1355871 RepID=UPI003D6FAB09
MIKNRLIPVLLLKDGWLVQSKGFSRFQKLGNPIVAVKRLSEWAADELIYLDISREEEYDLARDDLKHPNRQNFLDIIEDVSTFAFMPITVGGKIKTLNDIEIRLKKGADKVAINTRAVENLDFIKESAQEFGSQCVVISIDVKLEEKEYIVYTNGGKKRTNYKVKEWARIVQDYGAGEILINSIDRDGSRMGYDLNLIQLVSETVNIPTIALGGADDWEDFEEVLTKTKADAVAAANIFHYRDQSVYLAKKYLFDQGLNVRKPFLIEIEKI